MINTKGIALLSAAALLAPALATAGENLPWTYVEAGYIPKIGFDDFNADAGQLTGSIGFLGMGHAQIEYTNGDAKDFGDNRDFDGYRLTVGAHHQVAENTQLIGNLTYFDYSYDGGEGFSGADIDGWGVGAGLRHAIGSRMEVSGLIWYTDGDIKEDATPRQRSGINSTFFEISGRYNWTKNLSTGLTAFLGGTFFGGGTGLDISGGDFVRADIRWAFGNNDFSDLL